MNESEAKVIVGGLLHDIGKVIYRTGEGKNHSKSGYDYLTEDVGLNDAKILESVLYHHGYNLKSADIDKNSYAYITYIADNIASAVDRRKKDEEEFGFDISTPLQPVFNILNGNKQDKYYEPMMLSEKINYPIDEKKTFGQGFYNEVKAKVTDCLKGIVFDENFDSKYINSLLQALEVCFSYVPSSTAKGEVADISLYDHMKITAAVGSCIYQYLEENNINDYKQELLTNESDFWNKEAFLLFSLDVSGIQNFIYTIHSKDALRTLRARSFYLEIMMEHIVDTILEKTNLSRANLIYSGGGHSYMLLPNTNKVKEIIDTYEKEVNEWLSKVYDISLFVAMGYTVATANSLKNEPNGSYSELFKNVSNILGGKKAHRYNAGQIITFNNKKVASYTRECRVCKRLENVNDDGVCGICENLKKSSKDILYEPFFVVLNKQVEGTLPLPGDMYLTGYSKEKLLKRIKESNSIVRIYSKNDYYTGINVATKIWVGNYTQGQTFEELAESSKGIKRIGIFRADVDNLGQAFVGGFADKYNTLSRTATFSRQLSLFFRYYINSILENGNYEIKDKHDDSEPKSSSKKRNATIVYSGGDDLFIVGAWNDVVEMSVDIQKALNNFTENTLTISGGIGIYHSGYPISRMALEVGDLEDNSKDMPGKSAITLFDSEESTYKWNDFENKVIGEKYELINEFFSYSEDKGKSCMYHLLELIRGRSEKINFARYVYFMARMEPNKTASDEQKKLYKKFSKKMYEWFKNEEDCKQLCTAINLYAYMIRNEFGEEG